MSHARYARRRRNWTLVLTLAAAPGGFTGFSHATRAGYQPPSMAWMIFDLVGVGLLATACVLAAGSDLRGRWWFVAAASVAVLFSGPLGADPLGLVFWFVALAIATLGDPTPARDESDLP